MAAEFLNQVRQAISQLNPNEVSAAAERPLSIGVYAPSPAVYAAIEEFLLPATVSGRRRKQVLGFLHRLADPDAPDRFDFVISDEQEPPVPQAFTFSAGNPSQLVAEILGTRNDLGLPLARAFPPFREQVVRTTIAKVSQENALFALATALPDLAPGLLGLPLAIPQAVSDTAFLTANQIRMAFLLAAASDRVVGYAAQKTEIASIIAGAFGWRTLARELAGKIPLGGGLIPKASIAFAGTYVVGLSLDRLYRVGYGLTPAERRAAYGEALERGKQFAARLLSRRREAPGLERQA